MNSDGTFLSIDPGLSGAIAKFHGNVLTNLWDMPTQRHTLKKPTYKFKHTDPKIVYKSGLSKGERPKVLRTKGKYKTIINWLEVSSIISAGPADIVIEQQFSKTGRSKTIFENFGILKGICINANYVEPTVITAQAWKKHFNLINKEKEASILVVNLLGLVDSISLDKPLTHDQADAILIGQYMIDKQNDKTR